MKLNHLATAIATTTIMMNVAYAGGLERSQQSVGALFTEGNHASVTVSHVAPKINAKDMMGNDASGMIETYNDVEASVKIAPTADTAFALFVNKPWAVETTYPDGNMFSNELGATSAHVSTQSINLMAGQKLDKNFMIYGGIDVQSGSGKVKSAQQLTADQVVNGIYDEAIKIGKERFPNLPANLIEQTAKSTVDNALAKAKKNETLSKDEQDIVDQFNKLNGSATLYDVTFEKARTYVPALGFAFEKPEIALRTAVTYRPQAKYKFDTKESFILANAPDKSVKDQESVTEITFPQSVTVNFQTGLSEKHQLMGMADARWVEWSKFKVDPKLGHKLNNGEPLASYKDDSLSMSLGLGKQITPKLAGEARVNFGVGGDKEGPLTLLGPYGAVKGYSVGAQYKVTDSLSVAGGAQYMTIDGGKVPSNDPKNPLITVEDSDGFAAGVNVDYKF